MGTYFKNTRFIAWAFGLGLCLLASLVPRPTRSADLFSRPLHACVMQMFQWQRLNDESATWPGRLRIRHESNLLADLTQNPALYAGQRKILTLSDTSKTWSPEASIGHFASAQYPDLQVVSTNLSFAPHERLAPNHVRMRMDNTLRFPFADGEFDGVYMRAGMGNCCCQGGICGGVAYSEGALLAFLEETLRVTRLRGPHAKIILQGTQKYRDNWDANQFLQPILGALRRLLQKRALQITVHLRKRPGHDTPEFTGLEISPLR